MQIKAIAIDDEPLALDIVKTFCDKLENITLVCCFDNAIEGLDYANIHKPDLIFLDINMPDMTGIELAGNLKPAPMIIFTTAYKEFALEGFELDAVDYLLKPFSFERFEKAVQKAMKTSGGEKEEPNLFVFSEYRMIKIPCKDILYIESLDDYIKIHRTEQQKTVMTLMTLKKTMDALPDTQFARIHRSFIVSLNQIASLSFRKVILKNSTELPVSETYLEPLNKKLNIR